MLSTITDIHCHILPGIDDGSPDAETSIAMLRANKAQGVTQIIATPHYYSDISIRDFLSKRSAAFDSLRKSLFEQNLNLGISMRVGAEVYYRPSLVEQENLPSLCINGTKYLLLEMPFAEWESRALHNIDLIINTFGLTPIIAHIERYLPYNSSRTISELLSKNVIIQMNAGYLLNKKTSKRAKSMIKDGTIDIIASDCHNLDTRAQNLLSAFELLEASRMSADADRLAENAEAVFGK